MWLGKEVDLPHPGRIVLDGDRAPNGSPLHLRPMHIVAKRSPVWATAELLHSNNAINLHHRRQSKMAIVLRPRICDVTSPYLLDECVDCGKRRAILGERTCPRMSEDNLLCTGWTGRDAVWVGLCGLWVQYSMGCTLAPLGEWKVHVRRRCGIFWQITSIVDFFASSIVPVSLNAQKSLPAAS